MTGKTYNEIFKFIQFAESDSTLMSPFLYYKESAEERILNEMSELGIDELRTYYDTHSSDSIFVGKVINEAVTEVFDSADYYTIKYMRSAFQNSVFSDRLNTVYLHLRDSLLDEYMNNISEYEASVREVSKSVMSQVFHELDSITLSSIEKVLGDCMENELPRRDKKAVERIEMMYKKYVNIPGPSKVLMENVSSFVSSIDESICELFKSMVVDANCEGNFSSEKVVLAHPGYRVLTKEFLDFSDVQKSINWVSVALTTASIVSDIAAPGTGTIFDVMDGGYSVYYDIKKEKNVEKALSLLGKAMYYNMNKSNSLAIDSAINQLDDYISTTFLNLRNKIYEEF